MSKQGRLFEVREMRMPVKAFVRERLCGLELRQAARAQRRADRRGRKAAGGGAALCSRSFFDE